jgi:hypothetical protein
MRRYSTYIATALILFLASCKKDPATLQIRFTPTWGNDALKVHTTYSSPSGYLSFTSLDMYLSHIKLIKTDNSEIEVDSAVLILYNDNAITINLNPVKGDYKGIKLGIGLDSLQNNINPADVPDNDPVYKDNTLYWTMNREHLFIQMEGASGSNSTLGSIFFYHIGFDSLYRSASVTKSFSVADGQSTTLNLKADIQQVFNGTNAVNVISEPSTHTDDYPVVARKVADNFTQIFSIQ